MIRSVSLFLFALAVTSIGIFCPRAEAHGGQYTTGQPQTPGNSTPRQSGPPRGGGVTPGTAPTWENWWEHNKEDFFDVRARRQARSDKEASNEGYNPDALHQAASPHDIRDSILPALVAALRDKSTDVRDAAAVAVGRAGSAPEANSLVTLLGDSVPSVREAAILGLGLLKNAIPEQMLIDLMTRPDTDFKERGLAAVALGFSGGTRAREALMKNLGSDSPIAGAPAIRIRQLEGSRALGVGLIGAPESTKELIAVAAKASTRDNNFLPMLLQGLTKLADGAAVPFAMKSLDDKKDDVRRSACILFGRCLTADQTKEVKKLIAHWDDDSDLYARNYLTISLGRIGGPDAVAKIKSIYENSKNREERCFAALALGIARDAASAPMLRERLTKERDVALRSSAALGLAIMNDATAGKLIHEQLSGAENPDLQAYLVTALAMLDYRLAIADIRKLAVEARQPQLVRSAGLALGLLEDATSLDVMLTVLKNSGSIAVKGGVAAALGRIADRRAIEPLIKMLQNPAETDLTRAFATVALGIIADKKQKSEFSRVSIDVNYGLSSCDMLTTVIDIY